MANFCFLCNKAGSDIYIILFFPFFLFYRTAKSTFHVGERGIWGQERRQQGELDSGSVVKMVSPPSPACFFFLSRGGEGEGQMLLCPRALSGKRRTKVVIKENLSAEGMSLLKGRSVGKMLAWVKIALQLNSLSFNSG